MTPDLATTAAAVEIDSAQVDAIAGVLRDLWAGQSPAPAKWDDPLFWNVDASPEDRCQYLAIGNAINFRFWEMSDSEVIPSTGTIGGHEYRGSMYLWRRLRAAVEDNPYLLDADFLSDLTEDQFGLAFRDDRGNQPMNPGISDRLENLRNLGTRLKEHWSGEFINVIRAAGGSLDRFATLCGEFRAFDDPVRKLTMVNTIMLTGSGLAIFDSDAQPGIDYHLVKQALRQGLVAPPDAVQRKIQSHELLDPSESLALRSAVLSALLEVGIRAGISTAVIDNLYWLNRRICGETQWLCSSCPFEDACTKRTEFALPLELTRYY